jgi:hypothetical protein
MKYIIKHSKKSFLLLFLFLITLFISCEDESSLLEKPEIAFSSNPNQPYPLVTRQVRYNKMIASDNVQNLVFDEGSNSLPITTIKDSVIVFVEGGPKHTIDLNEFNEFKSVVLSGGSGTIVPNGFPNHSFIGMRQMHELNPTVYGSGTFFTPNNAEQVNNQTLDMIERVVNWLKLNNKVVFLYGHSNGSFMVQNYMASGRTNPSYYIISGTRLKINQDMVTNYKNYVDFSYADGTILNTTNVQDVAKPYFNVLRYLQMNHNKNYTKHLVGNSMLSKTFYSLGLKDEALGKIDDDEIDFINNNEIIFYQTDWGYVGEEIDTINFVKTHIIISNKGQILQK